MDYVGFIYNKDLSFREIDWNIGDYFDAEATFNRFMSNPVEEDEKFIRIIAVELDIQGKEQLYDFLELKMPEGRPSEEEYIELIYSMIGYGFKQRFWTIFTNDYESLSMEKQWSERRWKKKEG